MQKADGKVRDSSHNRILYRLTKLMFCLYLVGCSFFKGCLLLLFLWGFGWFCLFCGGGFDHFVYLVFFLFSLFYGAFFFGFLFFWWAFLGGRRGLVLFLVL